MRGKIMKSAINTTGFLIALATILSFGCGDSDPSASAPQINQDVSADATLSTDASLDGIKGFDIPSPDDALEDTAEDVTPEATEDTTQDLIEDASQDTSVDAMQDAETPEVKDASISDVTLTPDGEITGEDSIIETDATPLSSQLAIPCDDFFGNIYNTPESSLEPDVPLGSVSSCTADNTWSQNFMSGSLSAVGAEAKHGVEELRISYRTERASGAPGASSAFVLLPEPRPTEPMNTIVWAHGTTGLADHCAPSGYPGYYGYLPYAFAAQGYAVIGPDYAGLGNEGIQGYGNVRDTSYSLLDAPAALTSVLGADMLSGDVVMIGHSQGGGAVLNAQSLESEHPIEGELVGVIDIAGTMTITDEINPNSWSYWDLVPANYAQGTSGAFGSLYVYAYLANALGEDQADLFFGADWKDLVSWWIENLCIGDIIGNFGSLASNVTFEDIYDPSFPAGVLACLEPSEDCEELYANYVAALKANLTPLDPEGGRVFVITGMLDTITKPEDVSCAVDKMAEWGVTADTCVDPLGTHSSVVDSHIKDALAWTAAVLAGQPAPVCSTQGALPVCP